MDIALANRMHQVKPSPTLAVAAKAAAMRAEGKDIIGLGTGEPDFDTPLHIKKAAIAAIEAGFTKYTAVDGIVELKQAIIDKFKRDNGLDYKLNQILVSVGGKQSIYNLCQAFINEGDELELILTCPHVHESGGAIFFLIQQSKSLEIVITDTNNGPNPANDLFLPDYLRIFPKQHNDTPSG